MFKKIFSEFEKTISVSFIREVIKNLNASDCKNSFSSFQNTANYCKNIMTEYGFKEIEIINLPADGKTKYGDWTMPKAWDVYEAELKIIEPENLILADYNNTPTCVLMYSSSFEADKIEVIDFDQLTDFSVIKNKIIFTDKPPYRMVDISKKYQAKGIITCYVEEQKKNDIKDATVWWNSVFGPWSGKSGCGFSIPFSKGMILKNALKKGKVNVSFKIKTKFYNGTIPIITGIIPGISKKEVLLFGHIFEPGANDNASGPALILEISKLINQNFDKPKRSIRVFFSFETWGTIAYFAIKKSKNIFAGLNLDMVSSDFAKSTLRFRPTHYFLPSFPDFLLVKILDFVKKNNPDFNWLNKGPTLDNLFLADPMINIPCPALINWPDPYYHTSFDTIDKVNSETLSLIGAIVGTYVYFLIYNNTKDLIDEFKKHCKNKISSLKPKKTILTLEENEAKKIIYKRKIFGVLSLLNLKRSAKEEFRKIIDAEIAFSPMLMELLYYLNGKNSIFDIYKKIIKHDEVKLEFLLKFYAFLEKYGYIEKV